MNDTVYDIWLSAAIAPGGRYEELFANFRTAGDVFRASEGELVLSGIGPRLLSALRGHDLRDSARIAEYCAREGVRILVRGKPGYPSVLENIPTPPYLLYVRGTLPDMAKELGIGVVGTRNMTSYGMENTYRISYALAASGAVVVSGMARGIDGTAAAAALEAGGRTVAVIGCGLDTAYPAEHAQLLREIPQSGAVISEYYPGAEPVSGHFPIRNRIISGLSRGLFVAEAGRKSGAMLTAKDAKEQGKDLFALPGRIGDAMSEGPNALLREGARPVFGAEDILSFYEGTFPTDPDAFARAFVNARFSPERLQKHGVWLAKDADDTEYAQYSAEREAQGCVPEDTKTGDFYARMPKGKAVSPDYFVQFGYRADEAMSMLTLLEITGFVRSIPGGLYQR